MPDEQTTAEVTEATPSLASKLAAVMAEVGRVPKSGHNDFHNYDYVTEADLVEAVREKLAARNVVLLPSLLDVSERQAGQDTISTARVRFTFVDGDSDDELVCEWAGAGADRSDKGLYKAYTGALKYFLMKTFLIATGDDPEADQGKGQAASAEPPDRLKLKSNGSGGSAEADANGKADPDGDGQSSASSPPDIEALLANASDQKKAIAPAKLRGFGVAQWQDLNAKQREEFVAWLHQ